jgi:hypothetical protein
LIKVPHCRCLVFPETRTRRKKREEKYQQSRNNRELFLVILKERGVLLLPRHRFQFELKNFSQKESATQNTEAARQDKHIDNI